MSNFPRTLKLMLTVLQFAGGFYLGWNAVLNFILAVKICGKN